MYSDVMYLPTMLLYNREKLNLLGIESQILYTRWVHSASTKLTYQVLYYTLSDGE